jgi:hypothetical protein
MIQLMPGKGYLCPITMLITALVHDYQLKNCSPIACKPIIELCPAVEANTELETSAS